MAADVQHNNDSDTSIMKLKYMSSIFDALVNPINNNQFVLFGENDFYNVTQQYI